MIHHLYIKDFAIIDEMELDLKPGLTVITGETGSGKSILLDALSVSLGRKADKIMVRNGSNRSVIETKLENSTFRRLIFSHGRTKAFRNDEPITIGDLGKVNEMAVDFHGQHDQQLILNVNRHIDYLDRYCRHDADLEKTSQLYSDLSELKIKLKNALQSADERKDRLELLNFQANEIDAANLKVGEDIILENEYKRMFHIEEILKTLRSLQGQINSDDQSIVDMLSHNHRLVESLVQYDENLKVISDLLQSSVIQLQEAGTEISGQLSLTEFDPDEISKVEQRLQVIESLKRKYGGSIESVLEKRISIQKEVKSLVSPEQSEDELHKKINMKEKDFSQLAIRLHKSRVQKSKKLSNKIENAMAELNMLGSDFEIKITQQISENGFVSMDNNVLDANARGIDMVEFFLSANPGEPVKPLATIASGGEISRIMLAIKTVFQDLDPVQTLVFDEIDSGISGKAAEKVAEQLVKLSKSKQVFCITHLSQIARSADHHLHIVKSVKNGQTFVKANYLNELESPKLILELFTGKEIERA